MAPSGSGRSEGKLSHAEWRAEQELRALIDTVPAHIWRADAVGRINFLNQRGADFIGRGARTWPEIVHPHDLFEYEARWDKALRSGTAFEAEVRLLRTDGQHRWFIVRAAPQRDATGQVVSWSGINTDIDGLKPPGAQGGRTEEDERTVIDAIPAHIWTLNADGSPDYLNRRRIEYTGPDIDFLAIIHPDDRPEHDKLWEMALATGKSIQLEVRLRRFDGTYRWFLFRAEPQHDTNGRVVKWFGTNTDIDDLRRAEVALRRSEAYLADAQRLSKTGTLGWPGDASRTFWSDETYRILGYERSIDPSMERVFERIHPEDVDGLRRAVDRARDEGSDMSVELRMVATDGSFKHLRIVGRPMRQVSGESEFIGAITDITAARQSEEALQRAHSELAHVTRVATLGELTASIAHEVNQPLAGIVTNGEACLRWLRRDVPNLEEAAGSVGRIISDGRRAGEVVRRLRALARKDEPRRLPLDINDVVEESLPLVRHEFSRRDVTLELALSQGLPLVLGDRVQLQQVVINLIVNGIQAMSDITDRPGILTISSRVDEARGNDVNEVTLAVRDCGVGVDPAGSDRLFDPFFTTRAEGMGMGLSICRSIIEAHGGRIWVATNGAVGAVFLFALPAHQGGIS